MWMMECPKVLRGIQRYSQWPIRNKLNPLRLWDSSRLGLTLDAWPRIPIPDSMLYPKFVHVPRRYTICKSYQRARDGNDCKFLRVWRYNKSRRCTITTYFPIIFFQRTLFHLNSLHHAIKFNTQIINTVQPSWCLSRNFLFEVDLPA